MIFGFTPATADARIVANGVTPSVSAFSLDIITSADAASFKPELLQAVTVPPLRNTGCKFDNASIVVCGRGCSSVLNVIGSPILTGTSIGTICSRSEEHTTELQSRGH